MKGMGVVVLSKYVVQILEFCFYELRYIFIPLMKVFMQLFSCAVVQLPYTWFKFDLCSVPPNLQSPTNLTIKIPHRL